MNNAKKSSLNQTYRQFMETGFKSEGLSSLQKIVVKEVAGFGSAIDEKIKGINGLKTLLQNQKKQTKGMKLTWTTKPFSRYVSEDENTAVFAGDVYLNIKSGKELIKMYLRFSVVLNYINNQWKVVHWHGSKPEQVQSEADTYGIDNLKQKNAELEKLVKEKTVDLTRKNRELEIEAALERVRSRAMAMHTSDELKEVAKEMRTQLHLLGQKELETCAIHLWDESSGQFEAWAALRSPDNKGKIIESESKFKVKGIKILEENFQNYRNGKKDYVLVNDVARARQFFEALKPVDPKAYAFLSPTIKNKKPRDISAYWAVADFDGGSMVMVTMNPPEDNSRALLRRFADVFGLAYRRFSDLQKAEAQAREAEIELGLERVRSRAMAMQSSDGLKALIGTLFTELTRLDLALTRCIIWVFDPATNDAMWWMANVEDPSNPMSFFINYHQHPAYLTFIKAWKNQNIRFIYDLKGKDKVKWDNILFNETELKNLPEAVKNGMRAPERVLLSASFNNFGGINVASLEPLSDEHFDILLRFAKVFDLTYTRFLDLQKAEAQTREAQIQLALERVRARTMAMQDSKELSDTSFLLANQVRELGINAWGCAFHIYADNEEGDYEWFSNEDGYLPFYKTPRKKYFKQYFENRHCEQGIFIKEFKGKACATHYDFLMQIPVVGDALRGLIKSGIALPTSQIDHIIYFEYGYLLFITYKPVPEAHHIFKRFTKEFEQTYIRFLDLQKAEAQTREAQIQLALERVRAKTMAMQKSDELGESAVLLFKQIKQLGIETYASGFNIWDKEAKNLVSWMSNPTGEINPPFEMPIESFERHRKIYAAWKKNETYYEEDIKDDALVKHYKFLRSFPLLDKAFKKSEAAGIATPDRQVHNVAFFKQGFLLFITLEPHPEWKDIFIRCATVFEQTYTRFNDLKQAEAQAREAQIETALERVRSRSMAMHKSEELKQVIRVVLDQFVHLKINVGHAGFYIDYNAHDDMHIWLADPNIEPFFAVLPYFDTPTWNSFLEAKAKGITLHTDLLDFKTKNKFYKSLFKLFEIPEEAKEFYLQCKGLAVSTVLLESVGLYIENFDGTPYTDEENNILLRFGKVFQQAYTRFLDLQKAEAQAREAQIEAALERVRSRAMAMQNSEELNALIGTVFTELTKLDLALTRCAILIYEGEENKKGIRQWMINSETPSMPMSFYIKHSGLPYFNALLKGWNERTLQWQYVLDGQNKFKTDEFLFKETELARLPDFVIAAMREPEKIYISASFNNFGSVILASLELLSNEHFDILLRFAKVFDLTYTRFNDLKQAEAQAKEAQIEAALERVRARTMAMQKSSELNPTADLLFEQLRRLGAELQGVAFAICDKDSNIVQKWTSIGVFSFPYTIEPAEKNMYEAWKNKVPLYEELFEGERIKKYYETLMEVPAFKQGLQKLIDAGVPMPTWQKNHAVSFQQGYLLIITTKPFVETQIFVRFGKVFEQTYTRFLDLQKAEDQAKEAKIEAALEKVRSRTMAMQSSDELQETAAILFEEFKKLGTEEIYQVTIGIYNEEERLIDFRVTDWAGSGQQEQRTFQLDMNEPTLLQPANAAWKEGKKSAVFDLTGERLQGWLNYRNQVSGITMHSQDTSGRRVISVAYFSKGHLSLSSPLPLAEETIKTLERFANVFDGTYTRFLDLEKAEAQAKEAKIEAALEKVRSRTLAMQKSDELAETAAVLFQQLIALGIEPNRLYIIIMKPDSPDLEAWVTDEDGSKVSLGFTANYQNNPSIKKMYEGWRQQKKSLVMDMQGKELQQYFHYLHDDLKVPFKGGLEQKRRIQYLAYFSHGLIGMASPDEQPAETLQLLERFAAVFNLTFTRFNDLKVAEAHAIQAEQDLIAIKEAKQNAEEALTELQSTQKQLIQSEKMASLGELTAGIAHEIQNPLNFVNNFSEVSNELIDEMNEELEKGELEEAKAIAADVKQNLEKINHHGKRAGDIVKGMLQHSRSSTGQKELTDINTLCDEYLRLAYHGLRAKDKSFNAKFETDFDSSLPKINVVPQEIGRVILNLINNAFFAVNDKKKTANENFEPTIIVSTKKESEKILISVNDNGNGIPATIKDKIFQPFFTTKPTGQGTGLGLSLSYDIIKAHGGELSVETREGEGTTLIIQIPAA